MSPSEDAPGTGGERRGRRPMPGGAEAVRAQRRAARWGVPDPVGTGGSPPGGGIVGSAWLGTAVFVVATLVAAVVPIARIVAAIVDLALFVAGAVLYLWGWAVAAGRSREDQISMWNLVLLEDIAPRRVRVRLLGALGIQVIVAAATCWITAALAFGWLVPMWGLANCWYWGARHGVFPPRVAEAMSRRRQR